MDESKDNQSTKGSVYADYRSGRNQEPLLGGQSSRARLSRMNPKGMGRLGTRLQNKKPNNKPGLQKSVISMTSLQLMEALKAQGVNYELFGDEQDHQTGARSYLPLHLFDDTDFDRKLNPGDWVKPETGSPARAITFSEGEGGHLAACTVTSYNEETKTYSATWEGGRETSSLQRINVCFDDEDNVTYVKRVAAAHQLRRTFEADIRYSLYVENMPSEEIQPLTQDKINRVLQLSFNTQKLLNGTLDTFALLQEINGDYAKTMNKIIFDLSIKDPSQKALKELLNLPEKQQTKKVAPYLAVVSVPQHDFPSNFGSFCFKTFSTQPEAIAAMVDVNTECLRLSKMSLYSTRVPKCIKLEEFNQNQSQSMIQLVSFLREKWLSNLTQCVKIPLQEVGGNEYNLYEKNREIYAFSKLKKMLCGMRYKMEDQLRYLVMRSLEEYKDFIYSISRYRITTEGTQNAVVTILEDMYEEIGETEMREIFGEDTTDEERAEAEKRDQEIESDLSQPPPSDLPQFTVNLTIESNKIVYDTPVENFAEAPLEIFNKGLSMLNQIKVLEKLVMEHLFYNNGSNERLSSVSRDEPWVVEYYQDIKKRFEQATAPLEAYRRHFLKFEKMLELDVDTYVKSFFEEEKDSEEVRDEVLKQIESRSLIEEQMPKEVWLGMFTVNCEVIRKKLEDRYTDMIHKTLTNFMKTTKIQCAEIDEGFQKIQAELKKNPSDIAGVTQMKEYMATVPQLVGNLKEPIETAMRAFEILEEFNFKIEKDVFRSKWISYGWPRSIHMQMVAKESNLLTDTEIFLKEMKQQQEEFMVELADVRAIVEVFNEHTDFQKVRKVAETCREVQEKLTELTARSRHFNSNEMLFNLETTDYREVTTITKQFEPYYNLWVTSDDWLSNNEKWMTDSFIEMDPEMVSETVQNYFKTITKVSKVRVVKENENLVAIAAQIKDEVNNFKPLLPLISSLRNPGMRERHWDELSEILPFKFKPDSTTTLTKIVEEYKMDNYAEAIAEVGDKATKEFQIESALNKMEDAWKGVEFEVKDYKTSGTYVVGGIDEIITLLDEHIVMSQAMQFSAYKKPFEERIEKWNAKLNVTYEVIEEWLQVQRSWMSLQSIFASPDINKQLPAEGKRFAGVDKMWRATLAACHENPAVLDFCEMEDLIQNFKEANASLNMVAKKLADYLDKKRQAFPRFFFLANEELLMILSQTADVQAVQPHLKKCFENMVRLTFAEGNIITHMHDCTGETLKLEQVVDPNKSSVEFWLDEVEQQMVATTKAYLERAFADYPYVNEAQTRTKWCLEWPGQAILTGSQLMWTKEIEDAFDAEGLEGMKKFKEKWLKELMESVLLVRGEMTKMQRLIMGALITLDVHAREVNQRLVDDGCTSKNDFSWICQLRYYQETDGLWAQMVQARFPYGYEYLGNSFRLVVTPLTDRCYMTLMSALALNLGGAPAGPAGTGKTETTKDLAKGVAKQCVVFNCSDGLNSSQMAKFFKGLAASGAWACFDEFNRINVEVLSVVAQQVSTVWDAIRAKVKTFIFEDTELRIIPTCSAFITMNPGYAGRSALPDNLAALFRPVAMMVPNYALIAEISLFSFGFLDAKPLSTKMVATFTLCSEQLSSQDHYDYGMRAVKTVITRAGLLKREDPNGPEDVLLLRALQDVNIPKFLKDDLPLFAGIMSDLFPGLKKPDIDYGDMLRSIICTSVEDKLQIVPIFLQKVIQLYETTVVRHGLMVVGPTGGGKTSFIRTLQKALTKMKDLPNYEGVKCATLNPKAITMGQLYGEEDSNTKEWSDGVLANIVREYIDDPAPDGKWVVFDGPVDAIWIENMNTVLDDNKKLCLVSGEILGLTPEMRMIFEVEDLAVASPATVSRCGMVYMEPMSLGSAPLVKSWLDSLPPLVKDSESALQYCFDILLDPCLEFLRRNCPEPVPTVDNNMAQSCMRLLDCFIAPYLPVEGAKDNEEKAENWRALSQYIDNVFIFCLVWSVGASTDKSGRIKFSEYLRTMCREWDVTAIPPETGLVYDFVFDPASKKWVNWLEFAPDYQYDAQLSYSELIIPTLDTIRYTYVLDLLVKNKKHVLFTGDTGTGKTINVSQYLSTLPDKLQPINLVFSAATSANQLEDLLFGKMTKRRARVFGPDLGKRFIVFVDDMNMPILEEYGAQPPIELLRQNMDHGGWYNRRTLEKIALVDINFIGAMGPPGGGRMPITPRFLRHFNQIAHTDLEDESLFEIFNTIMKNSMSKYDESLMSLSEPLVNATIKIYRTVCNDLLPTPSKSHYTFNLRDLSAVFQGMLGSSTKKVTERETFLRLWVHENQRVFKDRLVNNTDRQWLDDLISTQMNEYVKMAWADVVTGECLLFGNYLDGMGVEQKHYYEVPTIQKVKEVMEEGLREYNEENPAMKLVLFLDAISHVSRVCRVLGQPGGNALLLGVGGSGRQSLTKLAAYVSEYSLFMVQVHKNYGMADWREDLKTMLLDAGLKEKPTVFLFTDTQIIKESFLEDVNGILNTADVPNLYESEDLDNIFVGCKIDCQRKKIPATRLNAFGQYLNRIKANLHIVLAMSPMGEIFRTRLRMFPALVNCCTIDWFADWPPEALRGVANTKLTEEELNLPDPGGVIEGCCFIHESVADASVTYRTELDRYNYVTPTSYLELLAMFKVILAEKRIEVGGKRDKLQNGLDKLADAEKQVAELKELLTKKQPVLVATQKEVDETMITITAEKKDAAATEEVVSKQEADASVKAAECQAIKDDAQKDLDKALPALDAAVECLKELKKSDIDEVRNFKKPPALVVLTMEATCIMMKDAMGLKIAQMKNPDGMGKVPDYWSTASGSFLKDANGFLNSLKNYDKDNIPEKTVKAMAKYIENPEFTVDKVAGASKACRAICMWCHAMITYHEVAVTVEPKRQKLRGAEAELKVVMEALNEAKSSLKAVQDRLADLERNFNAMVAKSEALVAEVQLCEVKLERADILIGGLGGEKVRWKATVAQLNVNLEKIIGDVLISCGQISYQGAFISEYRESMLKRWMKKLDELKLPYSEGTDVLKVCGEPVKIREWNINGLPTDSVSIENGIIMSKARRWPLMIDPQEQAVKYVRNTGNKKFEEGMTVVKLTDKGFLHTMENCVRFGKWILIDSVLEELDPALEPLLLKQIVLLNNQPHVKVGENMVPYNSDFKLYMATKLPNPHYIPELQVKVTLMNFTITPSGLEDQMLGVAVANELPDVEAKKNALVVQNAEMKKQLQEIEDNILRLLAEATGDILEDETLIKVLGESKKTSKEIEVRVKEAAVTEKEVDAARKSYQPVAERASILYFCISGLRNVDPMYQYSLEWFVALFVDACAKATSCDTVEERLQVLNAYFTKSLYENICRSLFEAHKQMFSFLLAIAILQGEGKIDDAEWRFLVTGAAPKKVMENPCPEWCVDRTWSLILAMSDLPVFAGFEETFVKCKDEFKAYFDHAEPHTLPIPDGWDEKLNSFQKLIILNCLRNDKMVPAVQNYIQEQMGVEYNEPPQFNLELSYSAANNCTPLVFLLSAGADPAGKLQEFATEKGMRDKMSAISLGQGQDVYAQRFIEDAKKKGGWVFLQNCHLYLSWLPALEVIIDKTTPEDTHEDYRLWLTSMPSPKFPVSVLQNGVKMTDEPPQGIRANMTKSYLSISDQEINRCSKPLPFKKLLFSLCFFHAAILDRRKFGPLGWNIPYQFTEGDLSVSITQLREFIEMYDEVPFQVIHFLIYDVNYGGRVTDGNDRGTIETILHDYIKKEILDDDYALSPSGIYRSIPICERDDYIKYISSFPPIPGPEVHGMHENADMTSAQEQAELFFSTILRLLPKASAGAGKSMEEIVDEAAVNLGKQIPEEWDLDTLSKKYPTVYHESMNTVLIQEAQRYNKLIGVMRVSLVSLRKALKGEMVMSADLDKVCTALFNNLVPDMWSNVAYPSLMPLAAWFTDLLARLAFIQKWVDEGTPQCFWISGFFFPQAFLTGSKQNYARKYTKPVDGISFNFHVKKETREQIEMKPDDGVYIDGLFLQGCRYSHEEGSLVDSRPKELFTTMPVIWLEPIDNRVVPEGGVYVCPVYKTLRRAGVLSTTGHSTNFVLYIEVPTKDIPSKWTKAGVALFCALKY